VTGKNVSRYFPINCILFDFCSSNPQEHTPASGGTGGTFSKWDGRDGFFYFLGRAGRDFLDLFFGTNGTKNIVSN
jgi:hypothetical protein